MPDDASQAEYRRLAFLAFSSSSSACISRPPLYDNKFVLSRTAITFTFLSVWPLPALRPLARKSKLKRQQVFKGPFPFGTSWLALEVKVSSRLVSAPCSNTPWEMSFGGLGTTLPTQPFVIKAISHLTLIKLSPFAFGEPFALRLAATLATILSSSARPPLRT